MLDYFTSVSQLKHFINPSVFYYVQNLKNKGTAMVYERKVFYASMCFICHLTVKEVKLKVCSSCKLVSYCSESHQRKHWKNHKEFCRTIQKVEKTLSHVNLENNRNWYQYRTNLMLLSEVNLGRKLKQHEMNMILFPNNCQICHKRTDLKTCLECLCVSYCSDDHKKADLNYHSSVCHLFSLCCKTDMYQEKTTFYPRYIVREGDIKLMEDISFFISSNMILTRNTLCKEIEEILLSELLTCPLTLLYALNRLKYSLSEYTTIHVVGSSFLETALLHSWGIILDIHKYTKKLVIYFIGPDNKDLIDLTSFNSGRLIFKFSVEFYHDFVKSEVYEKPDIICAFNCGFHEYEGSQTDTWKKSLPFLIENKKLPFIFTSFTKDEAEQDLKQLLHIEPNLKAEIELNQFCSLRPFRDLENLGVYFNNKYIGIVKQPE